MNIGSSKIGKISPVFFPGINLRYADGKCLENILVLVTITPGQLKTINSSQRKKSWNQSVPIVFAHTLVASLKRDRTAVINKIDELEVLSSMLIEPFVVGFTSFNRGTK